MSDRASIIAYDSPRATFHSSTGRRPPWDSSPVVCANAGFTKAGMPIGMQLIAAPLDEATALRAAHAFQVNQPFQDPPHRDAGLI